MASGGHERAHRSHRRAAPVGHAENTPIRAGVSDREPPLLDGESQEIFDALANLAARDLLPDTIGPEAAISNDGQVIVVWSDLGETITLGRYERAALRFDTFVRLSGDPTLDHARGVTPVFYLNGWGEVSTDGSRLTCLSPETDLETRIRVGTVVANMLSHALNTHTWHQAMLRARSADVSWVNPK